MLAVYAFLADVFGRQSPDAVQWGVFGHHTPNSLLWFVGLLSAMGLFFVGGVVAWRGGAALGRRTSDSGSPVQPPAA